MLGLMLALCSVVSPAWAEDTRPNGEKEVAPKLAFDLGLGEEGATTTIGLSYSRPNAKGNGVLLFEPAVTVPSSKGLTQIPAAFATPTFQLGLGYSAEEWTPGGEVEHTAATGEAQPIKPADVRKLVSRELGRVEIAVSRQGYSYDPLDGDAAKDYHTSWTLTADYIGLYPVGAVWLGSPAISLSYGQTWTAADASTLLTSPDGGVTWVQSEAILEAPEEATVATGALSYAEFRKKGKTPWGYALRADGLLNGVDSLSDASLAAAVELWFFALPQKTDQPNFRIGAAPVLGIDEDGLTVSGLFELRLGGTRSIYELP